MPQMLLPIFPDGLTHINNRIGFQKKDHNVYYFNGMMPIFFHHEDDMNSFRFITAQIAVLGNATQAEIVRAFGISTISMKRYVKRYRDRGPAGFFDKPRRRGAGVLTKEVLEKVQDLLDHGMEVSEIAKQLDLKVNTLNKAIRDGRVRKVKKKTEIGCTKSERSQEDSQALMGMACTRVDDRVNAAFGDIQEARIEFSFSLDVRFGGVLLSLPALLINGLLKHSKKHFSLSKGFYGLTSIFLLIAFLSLARVKSINGLRNCSPGDLGKLLGLDRVPEVRTLREKLEYLSSNGNVIGWNSELSRDWMAGNPDVAGYLYVDGHVRVYHGKQTKLPKRYVARDRLCLRGTTDYWVNDALGQPFFCINAPVNPGLLKMLQSEIVPRLEQDVPNQPSEMELESNPALFRFALVFDREGYSPEFFHEMIQKRIACYTYRKYQSEDWCREEFSMHKVTFPSGEVVEMELAERGTLLGKKIWVREIRKLTKTGHQTALVTTDFFSDICQTAASMFSTWSQENFFKYMMQHFGIDRLLEYKTEPIAETTMVVNPVYRALEWKIKSATGKLVRRRAKFGAMTLEGDIEKRAVEGYEREKADLQEEISLLESDIEQLKKTRKETSRHITFDELPEEYQFESLASTKKHFVDSIKMIAYRAETAMANLIKPNMTDKREARALIRQIFTNEADLKPDIENGTLTVLLHNLTTPRSDRIVRRLCDNLNATETTFPGTNLRMIYKLVSDQCPPDHVV